MNLMCNFKIELLKFVTVEETCIVVGISLNV